MVKTIMAHETWKTLRNRAATYMLAGEALLETNNDELIQHALEQAHFALEIAMKSVIAKHGGLYPDKGRAGHDLETLIAFKWTADQSIESALMAAHETSLSNIGLSNWTMDCRYKVMLSHDDMKEAINDYRGLYKWINNKLV